MMRIAETHVLRRPGPGAKVMLLHGIGSNAQTWAPMLAALDPAIDAAAWDAPAYGGSAPLAMHSPDPADYAERLLAVLDGLGWHRAVIVGHSLGCLFAASFAAAQPDRVAGLMLLSPAVGYGVLPGQPLPDGVQARIDDLVALGPAEFAAKRAARLVYRPGSEPAVLEGVRRAMAAVNPDGYAQAVRALAAGLLRTDAARVTAPSLVAVGARDVVTPPANAEAVAHALRRCRPLVLVPDAGHALPQEAPALVAGLLETLLQDVSHG